MRFLGTSTVTQAFVSMVASIVEIAPGKRANLPKLLTTGTQISTLVKELRFYL